MRELREFLFIFLGKIPKEGKKDCKLSLESLGRRKRKFHGTVKFS